VRVIDERGANGVTVARVLTDPGVVDWSPNDRNLAFSAKLEGSLLPQLVLVSLDRGEAHSIGPADLDARDPTWSPDGRDIAFKRANPEAGLWIIGADGSGLRRLTTVTGSGEAFRRPAWSPDGRRIVFQAGEDGAHRIFTIDRDGRNERPLDSPFYDNGSPVWSPDGSAIAWMGSADPGNQPDAIVIVDRDGSSARVLETAPLERGFLAWSPDARRLLTVLADQHTSLVVLDATGQEGPIRIPAAGAFEGASWQRLTSP
jgi:Tol biopolymer transport system component